MAVTAFESSPAVVGIQHVLSDMLPVSQPIRVAP